MLQIFLLFYPKIPSLAIYLILFYLCYAPNCSLQYNFSSDISFNYMYKHIHFLCSRIVLKKNTDLWLYTINKFKRIFY